jgi:hypothetical protein
VGGLIAGILDITGRALSPGFDEEYHRFVSFNLLHPGYGAAHTDWGQTAVLGLVFHFLIATTGLLFITSPAENSVSW